MMDAAIGMAIVSASGDFERVSPAMSTLLGRDEPTLIASTWREPAHPKTLDIDLQLVQEVIGRTRETYQLTKRYLKPSGEIVWADLTVSRVRDEEVTYGTSSRRSPTSVTRFLPVSRLPAARNTTG